MEKKMIIAVALSFLILFTFYKIKAKNTPVVPPPTAHTTQSTGMPDMAQEPAAKASAARNTPLPVSLKEEFTEIYTEQYKLVFSNLGGSLKAVYLKEVTEKGKNKEFLLFDIDSPAERPLNIRSIYYPQLYLQSFEKNQGDDYIEYKWTNPGAIEITKRYTFNKELDYIDLMISVKNLSTGVISFSYTLTGPSNLQEVGKITGRQFLMANTLIDGKIWKAKSVKKGKEERMGNIEWTAIKNRYYALVLKPMESVKTAALNTTTGKNIITSITTETYAINPETVSTNEYLFYAGSLNEKKLSAIGYNLQDLIDYGFFGVVSKVLIKILRFFDNITHNWGVAIILLTILINIILFPLTYKSFVSMQSMKKIQPHMAKLKELHKDNPQKLNKEMMQLYKTYKVNPLGGCLPLLLQMPIFIALYQGLMRFVELKGAQFLWIKDLSTPDAVPLPFTLPVFGNHLNILPLLMVGVMVVQQRLSQSAAGAAATPDQASQQKMMMIMMPIFFGFLFYKMPAGLVLYWLTNSLLMTTEQALIAKRIATD